MNIKAEFINNKRDYMRFACHNFYVVKRREWMGTTGVILFLGTVFLALYLLNMWGNYITSVICFGLAVLYPLINLAIKVLRTLSVIRKRKNFEETTNIYEFTDDKLIITTKKGKEKAVNELSYSSLYRVYFTNHAVYVYINQNSALIVSDGLNAADKESLKEYFRKIMPDKTR